MRPTHVSQTAVTRRRAWPNALVLGAAIGATTAFPNTGPLSDLPTVPGSAPLGLAVHAEQSPCDGGGTLYGLPPLSTQVAGVQIGKPFIERLNGWPLDIVGYVGVLQHDDRGLAPNGLQLEAFMKAYYYSFPWIERVDTRLGLGVGLALAQRVPYTESSSQAARGHQSSRLLNCLEPSIDVSLGDLIGNRALKNTYLGFGVSQRSGIFGASRLLGNANGGSNYIYTYLETVL